MPKIIQIDDREEIENEKIWDALVRKAKEAQLQRGAVEVKAPHNFARYPRPYIFLAGSIEQGTAEDWQKEIVKGLPGGTILNPRRDHWDSSWEQSIDNTPFREQVQWELIGQENADLILMHFDPATKSPITLLELGLFHKAPMLVHCPEGFWRKGNVDIVCNWYGIRQVPTIEAMIEATKEILRL